MIPFRLRKWYFDLITTEGHVLYLYFIAINTVGIRQGNVSAHLTLADRESSKSWNDIKPAGKIGKDKILFGQNCLTTYHGHIQVQLQLDGLSVDLQYASIPNGWTPVEDGMLIKGKNYLSWCVPQTRASVKGAIHAGSQEIKVRGLGYHDLVETTIPPWRLPITELIWGRAHCGAYTVVYDQIKMRDGDCLQHLLLREESDGSTTDPVCTDSYCGSANNLVVAQRFNIRADETDQETKLIHDEFRLDLHRLRILEHGPIATNERIKPKLFKELLIRTSGEAMELKMLSDASLHIGEITAHGMAIHERVSWRKKGSVHSEL
jgi:hypothetical protein